MRFAIDEFAEIVHPRDGHPKIFAMIDAYLDESGIHNGAAICAIAGYFGAHGQWRKFERAWRRVLKRFRVPIDEFHAKDLYPKATGFFWRHWKHSDEHEEFLKALAETIADHSKIKPVGFGIVIKDFFVFDVSARQFFTGATVKNGKLSPGCPSKPYFVPFQKCIVRVCDYTGTGKAHFFFGLDRTLGGYAAELFRQIKLNTIHEDLRRKLGDPSFPLAKETPQLQAADFLACLYYHHLIEEQPNFLVQSPLLRLCVKNRNATEDFALINESALRHSLMLGHDLSLALSRLEQSST